MSNEPPIKSLGMKVLADKPKATMTLNLQQREMDVIDELAESKQMTKTAIMRQALRLYQSVDLRIAKGERMFWKNADGTEAVEIAFMGGCG